MRNSKIRVLVPLANGFEEIEAITPIDIFRRAGWEVVVAGVGEKEITGAHGIKVVCEVLVDEVDTNFQAIVLPGGSLGAQNLAESWTINEKMLLIANQGGVIAAICASPAVVLGPAGLLEGHKAVCYPGVEEYVPNFVFSDERVCVDGNLITARAAGCATEFALAIVSALDSKQLSDEIAKSILFE